MMVQAANKMRVMIAGGGTGGHAYPGIAIYRALTRRVDVEVLFVGAKTGVESAIFTDLGLPHVLLPGSGVRGASATSKLASPFVLMAATARAIKEIFAFKPDVVIGTGGYASVAAVLAAVACGRKRVLQEQNSVPGMTNRWLSRFAHLVLLGYERSRSYFGAGIPCAVVGNPLRMSVDPDRKAALDFFGLDAELPTVLIFGGSRGAHSINEAARAAAGRILATRKVQFVFLAGRRDFDSVSSALGEYGDLIRVYPFLEEIHHAYSVADVAVSRAGASSVFELAAFGVPTVFVPYPYAADDHQQANVADLQRAGAAEVLEDAALDGQTLETIIVSMLDDNGRRNVMADRMREWVKVDADEQAANRILELIGSRSALSMADGSDASLFRAADRTHLVYSGRRRSAPASPCSGVASLQPVALQR
jgi:UDP-N-acetylglucosamine--N-acetylmuramyl-(pentapeptide) pyrophosphoryl-undecaprenol N-acetylglucosamine transferase